MYTEKLTYKNYNDETVTDTFHFNLSKAELTSMQYGEYGGMIEMVNEIIEANDKVKLIKIFERILQASYGKKTPDGLFKKSPEILDDFMASAAYPIFYMRFASDDKAAADFINQVLPKADAKPEVTILN